MSENYIEGKVIIVTGAASGFGRLVCQKTAALGASIIACDINEHELEETVRLINDADGRAMAVRADVTNRSEMLNVADQAVTAFSRIDVIINNAGVMPLAFYSDHEAAADAWDQCIDINFKGVLNGITAVHDQMLTQGRGHVINISSISRECQRGFEGTSGDGGREQEGAGGGAQGVLRGGAATRRAHQAPR